MGKTELIHALHRGPRVRNTRTEYGFNGAIDPYGTLARSGRMSDLGATGLDDFKMERRLGQRLDIEHVKGFARTKSR